jgi:hypothetical protein
MADLIVVTPAPVVLVLGAGTGASKGLDLRLAIDISRWDIVDLSVGLLSISTSADFSIEFLSSMQMDNEDASWGLLDASPAGSIGKFTLSGPITAPTYKTISLPGNNPGPLRYMRWRVYASSGTPTVTFVISGLGRRKGS